jgi:phosphopantetheinyl transferase
MLFFNIGLSFLSSYTKKRNNRKKLRSAEARRILPLLDDSLKGVNIEKDENGRPYYPDLKVDFNISHSKDLIAVSLVKGEKPRTGCDIEYVRPMANAKGIAESYFSISERDYIFQADKYQDTENKFFTIWTLKECFLKLKGLSVFDMRKAPSFIKAEDPNRGHFAFGAAVSAPLSFYVYELRSLTGEKYILAAAIEGDDKLRPEIHWFSQSLFPARSIVEIKAALSPTETVSPKM